MYGEQAVCVSAELKSVKLTAVNQMRADGVAEQTGAIVVGSTCPMHRNPICDTEVVKESRYVFAKRGVRSRACIA